MEINEYQKMALETAVYPKEYKAIYLGYAVKDNPTTEPFGVFTMTEEDGVQKLFLRIEFMDVNIGLKKA